MIKKGDEILVDITDLNSEGKGISKLEDGFVIFSENTLTGDKALIKIKKKKSNYAEAKLVEIIKQSDFRVEPKCKYFGVCGGCKIQNYEYDKQVEFKTNIVKNAFERIGGFKDLIIPTALKSDEIFYYRNKMEFSFSDDKWMMIPPNPPLQEGNIVLDEECKNPPYERGLGGFKFDYKWLKERGLILGGFHLPYNPKLVERAKELRKNLTLAEKKLWYEFLRNHKERFLRQRMIDNYIVDFYCSAVRLIIEIDGEHHLEDETKLYDDARTKLLEEIYRVKVMRFLNKRIITDFKNVCEKIDKVIEERKSLIFLNSHLQEGKDDESENPSYEEEQESKKKSIIPHNPPLQGGNTISGEESKNHPYEGEQAGFALGLHVPKFHSKIIDIDECFLQSKLSNEILNFTREFFINRDVSAYSTKSQSGFLRFLIIRQSKNTEDLMVNLITYDYYSELMKEYSEQLRNSFSGITTIVNSISQKKAQVASGDREYILYGNGFLSEKLKTNIGREYIFNISPQSFFQTNTLQAEKLFNMVVSFAEFKKNDNVLDLYCGTGTIAIFISEFVNKVLGIELIENSISDAIKNAELNKIKNTEFVSSDIKDFLEKQENLSQYNKLILDPPRSGLHPKVCEILSETKLEKILYVSCNPHTQARDLELICNKGNFMIEKVQPIDMFPHTYHVENVVSLKNIE